MTNATDNLSKWDQLNQTLVDCQQCPRLVAWREKVARERRRAFRDWEYWGKPVPGFGDTRARILVVGLAPGAHGANRTGRMFTGDGSGDFLYPALHKSGFANQPEATRPGDGLVLTDMYISSICRCVPPANKPTVQEMANCLPFLAHEVALLTNLEGIVALGGIAFGYTLRLYRQAGQDIPRLRFGHAAGYQLGEGLPWLIASYHPSRQNTQTGRLTRGMFDQIWADVRGKLA